MSRPRPAMRTNPICAASCAATPASARSNSGVACRTTRHCGSTGRGSGARAAPTPEAAGLVRVFLVVLFVGLHKAEARLELAEQDSKIALLLRREAGEDFLLTLQQ